MRSRGIHSGGLSKSYVDEVNVVVLVALGGTDAGFRVAAGPSVSDAWIVLECYRKQVLPSVRDVGPPGDCGYHGR